MARDARWRLRIRLSFLCWVCCVHELLCSCYLFSYPILVSLPFSHCPSDVVRINPRFEAITETNILRARAYLGEKIENSIRINNRSGSSLDLYWVDHNGNKDKLITLQDYTDQQYGSVVNNEFEAQEVATNDGPCATSPTGCRTARFKNHGGDERKSSCITSELCCHNLYFLCPSNAHSSCLICVFVL